MVWPAPVLQRWPTLPRSVPHATPVSGKQCHTPVRGTKQGDSETARVVFERGLEV